MKHCGQTAESQWRQWRQLVSTVKDHLATLKPEDRVTFIFNCMEDYCERCGRADCVNLNCVRDD